MSLTLRRFVPSIILGLAYFLYKTAGLEYVICSADDAEREADVLPPSVVTVYVPDILGASCPKSA